MDGIFETIKLDNKTFLRPSDFTPARETVLAGEYTSCTGKTIGDIVGWKFSDISLEWDMLPEVQMLQLVQLPQVFDFEFEDKDGVHVEQVVKRGHANTATRFTDNGNAIWKNVQISLSFVFTHNE